MSDENPLRHGPRISRFPEPCALVIFGGSGDLACRKLIPALFRLSTQQLTPAGFTIIGLARSPLGDEKYREMLRPCVEKSVGPGNLDDEAWSSFAQGIHYISADYNDPSSYEKIKNFLSENEALRGTGGNRLYYLATAPKDYPTIIFRLGEHGMAQDYAGGGWMRVIIEKPFGSDLHSAQELNKIVSSVFLEKQVYRIDHYLGKETVQNILVFRFANGIFESVWNRQHIDCVQITAAEDIGVGTRAPYYEQAGAIRDMVQNHILQLLALIAMEPPPDFSPDEVRNEKAKVLRSMRIVHSEEVPLISTRGQYGSGFSGGKKTKGYLEESGVAPDSRTETFVAMKLNIDNLRWAGVPFYIRTGKNLAKRVTEIAIIFHKTPSFMFRKEHPEEVEANVLAFRIQPDEGISLKILAKLPGQAMEMRPVAMDFRYGSAFGFHLADAYERLLLDCMIGDPTLFDRIDSVEAAWSIMQPFLDAWRADASSPIPQYPSGSWGPPQSDELLQKDNRAWRLL